jgi:glycopeptide antibiotics resistance protein
MRAWGNIALLSALALIVALTAFPRRGPSDVEVVPFGDVVNAIRFSDKSLLREGILESTANIAIYIPFGAALALKARALPTAVLYGLGLSTAIECAQLFLSGRTASVSDVLLNALGAALGYLLVSRASTSRAWGS